MSFHPLKRKKFSKKKDEMKNQIIVIIIKIIQKKMININKIVI